MSKRLTNKRKKIGGGKVGKRKGGDRKRVNDLFQRSEERSVSNIPPAFCGPIAIIFMTDVSHLVVGYERGWTQTISQVFTNNFTSFY